MLKKSRYLCSLGKFWTGFFFSETNTNLICSCLLNVKLHVKLSEHPVALAILITVFLFGLNHKEFCIACIYVNPTFFKKKHIQVIIQWVSYTISALLETYLYYAINVLQLFENTVLKYVNILGPPIKRKSIYTHSQLHTYTRPLGEQTKPVDRVQTHIGSVANSLTARKILKTTPPIRQE